MRDSRRIASSAACVMLACQVAACVARAESPRRDVRIAVLRDAVAGLDLSLVDGLAGKLKRAGFAVRPVTCDELVGGSWLKGDRPRVLMLTHSPLFPIAAKATLESFLKGGGHLVLMGGHAFSRPICKVDGRWVSQDQLTEAFASVPAMRIFFDFADGVSGWRRSSSKEERPTKRSLGRGKTGRCMRIDIKDLSDGWDTHAADLPGAFDERAGAPCFWAKATKHTPEMAVELDEKDGSRWIAVVKLTDQWKRYVVPPSQFTFWKDGSATDRSGENDGLKLPNATRISFGLAFGITSQPPGDHTLWIDEVGSAKLETSDDVDFSQTIELGIFSDNDLHALTDVAGIEIAPGQDVLTGFAPMSGRFAGTSAMGVALAARSEFTPLLAARDRHGRNRGWAGGLLTHYDGPYVGSNWLLFGITSPAFYKAPVFAEALVSALKAITTRDLSKIAKRKDAASRAKRLALTTPGPDGFLRLSDDGKHILYPDGRRFFMVGCNYLGSFDRKCYIGGGLFDVRRMEDDFAKARAAGINCMRFWLSGIDRDPTKVDAVKELARRYGIYLLLHLGPSGATGKKIVEGIMPAVRAFADEPMVLGYDLINEPYLGTVGAISYDGEKSPILKLRPYETYAGRFSKRWVDNCVKTKPEWPQMHKWLGDDDTRNLYAAYSLWNRYQARYRIGSYSTFPGIKDRLPAGETWREFIGAVDATFAKWISLQVDAIRRVDKRHLISVGYNTVLACLPANKQLDFVSHHIYEKPVSHEHVTRNITTMDRLARVWPDQPITLGEFGYSNGIRVRSGYLDVHASGLGEIMHYLHALAHGYDGCMKWSLTDWPIAVMRHNAPWIKGADKMVYESQFGLYYYDGTITGRPKPIALALRFLRDYVEAHGPQGKLDVRPGKTSIGSAYVYRGKNALFVGDVTHSAPELSFESPIPTNVMLTWNDASLRVMSTCDVVAEIDPSAFVASIRAGSASVEGRRGSIRMRGRHLALALLAGETVRIK